MPTVSSNPEAFINAGFDKYMRSSSRKERAVILEKLQPFMQYVDTQTISSDMLEMLYLFKDTFCYSARWQESGVADAPLMLRNIRITLSEERLTKSYPGLSSIVRYGGSVEYIDEVLRRVEQKKIRQEEKEEITEAQSSRIIFDGRTDVILGSYNHESRNVTLYVKSILENVRNSNYSQNEYCNFAHQLAAVLAHEMFHAYHALDYDSHGHSWVKDKDNCEIIIESLASYFERHFLYNEIGRFDMAKALVESWQKHLACFWPYAGAKYLQYRFADTTYHPDGTPRLFRYGFHDRYMRRISEPNASRFFADVSYHLLGMLNSKVYSSFSKASSIFYKLSLESLYSAQVLLLDYEYRVIDDLLNDLSKTLSY